MAEIDSEHKRSTIADKFDEGHASGFDYLRIFLAICVLCVHSFSTSYGKPIEALVFSPPLRGVTTLVLPMFFSLSGFLVAASLIRTQSIIRFLGLRALRLIPALAVEITLSALLLGPLFTTLPLSTYFADSEFQTYFLNILGDVHFLLPGLFRDNPYYQAINISLWTIPYELDCYIALTAIAILRIIKRRHLFLALIIFWHIFIFAQDSIFGAGLSVDSSLPSRILFLNFLDGVLLFVFAKNIPVSGIMTAASLVLSFIMLNLPYAPYFASFLIAHGTVGLGLLKIPKNRLIASGDYSYGIYLYAFPIQQLYAHLFPKLHSWYFNILFALPVTFIFAAFSWHAVEKHVLKLKKYLRKSPT